jgi:Protein of unknown function (DUF2934)
MSNLSKPSTPTYTQADRDYREAMIRQAAYFRSELRRACIDQEAEDWLVAERQVDAVLTFHPRCS